MRPSSNLAMGPDYPQTFQIVKEPVGVFEEVVASFSLRRSYQNLSCLSFPEPSDSKVGLLKFVGPSIGPSRPIPNRQREDFRGKASVFSQAISQELFERANTDFRKVWSLFSQFEHPALLKLFTRFRQLDPHATWLWRRADYPQNVQIVKESVGVLQELVESFSLSRSYQNLSFFALSKPSDSKV